MILDQYGQPTCSNRSFNRSANNNSKDRPWVPVRLDDIGKLIKPVERKTLVAVSRLLGENWGPARSILRQLAMYTVGKAWKPSMESTKATSDEVKNEAEAAIREKFCPLAGLDGKDFSMKLYELVMSMLRDGDGYYLLTEWETGFPAIQVIPAHRVGQREWSSEPMTIQSGPYQGLKIEDGIIKNRIGVTVAYRVLGDMPDEDMDVSARSMGHIFDSDYCESGRGYPVLSHGLNDGRDALQAHEWERLNMLVRSGRTFIEHTESGIPNEDPGNHFTSDTANCDGSGIQTGTILGGTVTTVRAGSGYKLESIEHTTPGEVWESFGDRMIRKMCAGVPFPVSFVWDAHSRGGGTAERRDIMQAQKAIEDIQSTIERHARRIVGYAYQKLVKLGQAPPTEDWWRWSFSMPPKITIDDGRASKAMLELWRAGVVSDDDLLTDMGKDPDDYWRYKFNKAADKELAFLEVQEKRKVTLDSRVKGMFTPNDQDKAEEDQSGDNAEEPTTQNDNEDDPADN